MKATYIDYSKTDSFSPALLRYLSADPKLLPFTSYPPTLKGFEQVIENKTVLADRDMLVKVLKDQYQQSEKLINENYKSVSANIDLLALDNTYTITTGHQLNIFTGPLYFIFKIVTAIKLAADLKTNFPDKNFVPVYWMATEDHDFDEINHTYIGGKKISWQQSSGGATGRLDIKSIEKPLKEYIGILGLSPHAKKLASLIQQAYQENQTLSQATRFLVNALFGDFGLVILDADDPELKKQFAAVAVEDIIHQNSFKNITQTNKKLLELDIDVQVNPREINFFYLDDGTRERIVFEDKKYQVLKTNQFFTAEELRSEIEQYPERFSPNVVMRPLYQEMILPNIAYVGGGAEIIYWLQLKQNFDQYQVDFPVLILRNSALLTDESTENKLTRLELRFKDIFAQPEEIKKTWIKSHSKHDLTLADEWQDLKCVFERIKLRAYKINPTLGPSTDAVKARLEKAVISLERKLMRAEKRNYSEALSHIDHLKNKLFPNGGLQERTENFGLFYVKHGDELIKELNRHFNPLDFKFTILH